jgi:dUTP pyrophosphatase
MKILSSKESSVFNINYSSAGSPLTKAHRTDAGFDIRASLSSEVTLSPGEYKLIDTGVRMALPEGLEVQVRPRSGLATKHGITVLNSPGTVDAGYRGEVKVILINHGKSDYIVKNGDAVAQLVFSKVLDTELILVKEVEIDTERQDKGFVSSDSKEGNVETPYSSDPPKSEKKGKRPTNG